MQKRKLLGRRKCNGKCETEKKNGRFVLAVVTAFLLLFASACGQVEGGGAPGADVSGQTVMEGAAAAVHRGLWKIPGGLGERAAPEMKRGKPQRR